MAAKRRPPRPRRFKQIIEGEVTVDDHDGIVVWDYLPEVGSRTPAHGFAAGGLIDVVLLGKRVRITIEEL